MFKILEAIYSHLYAGQTTDPHQAVGGMTDAFVHRTLRLDADGNLDINVQGGGVAPAPSSATTYYVNFAFAAAGSGNALEIVWASTVVRVLEIFFTKPSAQVTAVIRKQSAASTGGTAVAQTIVPANSANAAGSGFATVNAYTVVPTAGTLVGNIYSMVVGTSDTFDFYPIHDIAQPPMLISAGQSLAINVDAAATLRGMLVFTAAAT